MSKEYSDAKVLVVDDNNINLYAINQVLLEFGINADCVPSGKACLKKVSKKDYDLIFMDHMMPDMDGIETYRLLKEDVNFKAKVIALTANEGDEYVELYQEEGFAEYVVKPLERSAAERILDKYLGRLDESEVNETKEDEEISNVKVIKVSSDPRIDKLISLGFTEITRLVETGMPIEEFETLLSIFSEESLDKKEDADNYALENNLKDYAIIVHGLKNDAGMISDMELREHALKHEVESKAGNSEFVALEWPILKKHWENTLERIDRYFN